MIPSSNRKHIALLALLILYVCHHFDIQNDRQLSSSTSEEDPKEEEPMELPYDSTCPLLVTRYINNGAHPKEAHQFYDNSGAQESIEKGLEKLSTETQNIVFAGDSNMRQIFMSIACHAHSLNLWDSTDSFHAAFTKTPYNDARLFLNNSSQLFFAPKAGKINIYQWNWKWDPIETDDDGQDWLRSCKNRELFGIDTYSLSAPNEKINDWQKSNPLFETVPLSANDKVIINASMHSVNPTTKLSCREHNLDKLTQLLDCMADAREKGEDPGWPQLYYFRTNELHFKTEDGDFTYEKEDGCADYVDGTLNKYVKTEVEMLEGKIPMVGYDLDLDNVGRLHMGGRDCAHWSMPGVADVYAREVMREVFQVDREQTPLDMIGEIKNEKIKVLLSSTVLHQ